MQLRSFISGHALVVLLGATVRFPVASAQALPPPNQSLALSEADARPIEELDIQSLLDLPVVTASGGKAQTQSLAAANVTAITRDEIALHGWRSLGEVLSNVAGLYVIHDEVVPSLGVRGVTGGLRAGTRIVKVMINGVEVNFRPDLTAFLGPEYLPMEAVERIEVAKGPLSALYGANAFLAVVNVITRTQVEGTGEIAVRANSIRTNFGYGASGMISQGTADQGFLVAFGSDRSDRSGLRVAQTFAGQNPNLSRFQTFFADQSRRNLATPTSVFAQARLDAGGVGRFRLQGGLQNLDAMGEFQLNSVTTHQSRYALQNAWANVQHEAQFGESLRTLLSVGASRGAPTRDERLFVNGNNANYFLRRFGARTYDAAARLTWSPSERFSLDTGVDGSYEQHTTLFYTEIFNEPQGGLSDGASLDRIGADDVRNPVLSNLGVFAQVTGAPVESLPNLQLTGNLRVDFPNLFDPQFSFRLAAAHRWSDHLTTKLIGGRAFQSPSAVLLYGLPGFGNGNNVVGNRTLPNLVPLEPQTVHSVELVTSANLYDRVALEVGLYAQQVLDRIEFVQSGFNFRAENQGEQRNAGVEIKARGSWDRFSPFLILSAERALAFTSSGDLVGPATGFPNASGRAGVDVDVPELLLRANVQARGASARGASQSNVLLNNLVPYTLDPYLLLDLSLASNGLKLFGAETETVITVSVQNLLDTRYSEPAFGGFDIPVGGRSALVEFRQRF